MSRKLYSSSPPFKTQKKRNIKRLKHCMNHCNKSKFKLQRPLVKRVNLKTPVTWTNRQSTKSKEGDSRDVSLVAPKTGMTSCGWVAASLPVKGGK